MKYRMDNGQDFLNYNIEFIFLFYVYIYVGILFAYPSWNVSVTFLLSILQNL